MSGRHIYSWMILGACALAVGLLLDAPLYAQVTSLIETTIARMVMVLNVLIIGMIAYSGFLLAKGDSSGVQRIIYGIIGLIVVNGAHLIVEFFRVV